jgi:hypothetical protein
MGHDGVVCKKTERFLHTSKKPTSSVNKPVPPFFSTHPIPSRIPSLSSRRRTPVLAARLVVNGAYGRGFSTVRPPQFLLVLASNVGLHLGRTRAWQAAGDEAGYCVVDFVGVGAKAGPAGWRRSGVVRVEAEVGEV